MLELAAPFAISLPAISKHLKVLERAGLIARGRDAQRRPCSLKVEALDEITAWAEHTRQAWEQRLDRLEDYLRDLQAPKKGNPAMIDMTDLLEREIVLSRVIDVPRELVFKAWTDPQHIVKWFGPKGFICTTHEIDIRVGGRWRFDMKAPNGILYPNRMVFLEIKKPELIVIDHGSDKDDDPNRFRTTIIFDSQSDGKTVLTMRQLHPTKAQRDAGIGFGAVEYGYQTLDKLAAHVSGV